MTIIICNQGCVTDSFKPSAANNWRMNRRVLIAALLNKVLVTCPYCIVEGHFLESDLACLHEIVVITLFLLHRLKHGDKAQVAGFHILVPAFLDLLPFKLFHMSCLLNADGTIYFRIKIVISNTVFLYF